MREREGWQIAILGMFADSFPNDLQRKEPEKADRYTLFSEFG